MNYTELYFKNLVSWENITPIRIYALIIVIIIGALIGNAVKTCV